MAHVVDPTFVNTLARYGAADMKSCFNCGNCTAVCSLTENGATFPRKFIRYAQLGMADRIASSKEMWLCYYCGDCSATCPRQAEPGEFVAAARWYIISQYDPTRLARLLYTSKTSAFIFLAAAALILALVVLRGFGSMPTDALRLGAFINVEYIHYTGQAVIVIAGVIALLSLLNMVWRLNQSLHTANAASNESTSDEPPTSSPWQRLTSAFYEVIAQTRFDKCATQSTPWYLSRRFVHLSIMWGFLGLLAATGLDLLFKQPYAHVPLYYPMRMLGTLSGLFVLYGTTSALVNRFAKKDKYYAHSGMSDWLFLGLLWIVTITGFVVEITVYLPSGSIPAYMVFLVHIVLAMMLVLLLPFTKFAHAVLRPVALFIHEFKGKSSNA
ncbi:MAG: 4Fe-4S dicluster domain-containing protein [Desulfomonilaceae bacterium]